MKTIERTASVGGTTRMAVAETIVESIQATMLGIIAKHKFQVMELYPNDLKHDRIVLDKCSFDGATIGWVVGHTHTHLVVLGLEPEQNELVHCFTNLSASDKFYLISINKGSATFVEKSREDFAALSSYRIPYSRVGDASDFTIRKNDERLAHCRITRAGTYERPHYQVAISSFQALRPIDRAAVEYWCHRAVSASSGSLFTSRDLEWLPSVAPAFKRHLSLAA